MAGSGGLKTPNQRTAGSGYLKNNSKSKSHRIQVCDKNKKKQIRIKESLVDYFKELLGFMRELTKNQLLFIGWLFEAMVNQHPPAHHPLDACYYYLWMNVNRVNNWFHLGNQFCKK
jgi:hypothetical protein